MKHFGDITKINGAEVPIVDIITGGSPCQDLSVAGKVAGLEGDRSKLFLDQIRVVKEMRDECIRQLRVRGADDDIRLLKPRFMVWENVPNALSSPGKDRVGEDFRVVLEEIAKIADQNAIIPRFENGKWSQSGCILADRWSIAWRVHDAQFWGVPQRRKRLCLVADFTGQSAGEILFERKVLSGDNTEIRGTWEAASRDSEKSIERSDKILYRKTAHPINKTMAQGYEQTNKYDTLNVFDNSETRTPMLILENHPNDSRFKICADGIFPTLSSRMGTGGNNVNMVLQKRLRRLTPLECERLQGFPTIRKVRFTEMTKDEYIAWNINEGHIVVDTEYGKVFATRGPGGIKLDEPKELIGSVVNGYRVVNIRNGNTKIQCRIHRIVWIAEHGVIPDGYVIDHINNDKQDNRLCNLQLLTAAENSTKARADGLYKIHGEAGQAKITDEVHDFIQYVYGNTDLSIRQLSEIFGISKSRVHQIINDDGWTDIGDWVDSKGKKHKGDADSPRYKALGNSIALPFWQWMAGRIAEVLREEGTENPTMASLFDGIGGFALVFKECGVEPIWASEVEEFCIAVTKKHFPDMEED